MPSAVKPPSALDVFSGKNVPVAYALAWRGWEVEPAGWLLNQAHDLSDQVVQVLCSIDLHNHLLHFSFPGD